MRYSKILLSLTVILLMIGAGTSVNADLPSDLNVHFDRYHVDFKDEHAEANALEGNLTAAGSSLTYSTENDTSFSIPTETDVFLMPLPQANVTDDDKAAIKTWFDSDGPKLLWATGDSDFGSYFLPDDVNGLLSELGSNLRIGAESIEDPTNNDGAAYRVAATNFVDDGTVNAKVAEGLDTGIIMHGPAPVLAEKDGKIVSFDDIATAEVLVESSADAVALDSDLSETLYDYYEFNEVKAPFPMIAIQDMGDGKWVIVSGEAVFSDYKFMYGVATESGAFNEGVHEGKEFVDNVLHWFSEDGATDKITTTPATSDSFLPLEFVPFAAGVIAIAVTLRRRRN